MDIKKLNVTNVILTGILAALVFLCIDQRQGIKSTQEKHDDLHALMENHVGQVWAQNLKEDGRRFASAMLFSERVLENDDDRRKLLEFGQEGIDAYLSLHGGNVVSGMKSFTTGSPLYGFQVAMGVFPQVFEGVDKKSKLNKGRNSE